MSGIISSLVQSYCLEWTQPDLCIPPSTPYSILQWSGKQQNHGQWFLGKTGCYGLPNELAERGYGGGAEL